MIIKPSTRINKRYQAVFNNGKIIHFGLRGDKIKRENYINRHKKNEDWTKVNAGSLAKNLLWGPTTNLEENHKLFMKKFNIT